MIKQRRRRFVFPIALTLAALTSSCGGDVTLPDEGEAAEIEVIDGNEQVGPVGGALADPLVVRVTDTQGRPVPDQEVTFVVASGGGSLDSPTVTTGTDGLASSAWTLGPAAGAQQVRARTARGGDGDLLEALFTATGVAGSGSALVLVDGDEQTGPVSSALADSLVVRTTDDLGNPVGNVEVTWSVSGGGSISPVTVVTDADGLAAAERVLGPAAGPQTAQATVEGFTGSPVSFTHTAVPANPTVLVLVSGNNQTAPGGFEVAEDLVVRLEDPNGNGIGGRPITWVVPAGSGSVAPVSTTTNANGLASTRWTLPSAVGAHTVSAVFSGLPPVAFTATSTADAPTTIEMVSGNGQSAPVGAPLTNPLVVRVTDANDNPVAGVPVAWTAVGGGSVSADNTATDAQGLAQVTRTLGSTPGPFSTTAAVEGLQGSPITFVSTATVGAPAKLAIVVQPGSPTVSGTAFSPSPVLQVQDAQGNSVPQGGIPIIASITSGQVGATLENDQQNTNANGRKTFTNLQISGPPANDYVLTFTAMFNGAPLVPVSTVALTVTAGGATRLVLLTQPSSSAESGVAFPTQPVVQVQDATGNPVVGSRTITATIGEGGGTLIGDVTAGTGSGSTATFEGLGISGTVGSRTLIFSSGALTPAESNPINLTTGPAADIAIVAGDGQTAPAGSVLPTDPSVVIRDSGGNPVQGAEVTFAASNGGSASPNPVTTGSDGRATTNWTLGTTPGENELTASAPGAGSVVFSATGASTAIATLTELSVAPPSPQVSGTSVTLTATVTSGEGTPGGTVEFRDGVNLLGSDELDGAGVAAIEVALTEGTHSITAHYLGAGDFEPSASAAESYEITAANVPPEVGLDAYETAEDTPLIQPAPGVLANDNDPDGDDDLTAALVAQADHGTVTLNPDGGFTYAPDQDYSGPDEFSYRASDGEDDSEVATVSLTVSAVNDPPSFVPGANVSVPILEAVGYTTQWATGMDPGPDETDQELDFEVGLDPADAGAFLFPPQISDTGVLTFTANPLILTESRDIVLSVVLTDDAGGATDPVTLTITLNP